MNGPEHYAEAERLLDGVVGLMDKAGSCTHLPVDQTAAIPAAHAAAAWAQVHATLALAAATVESAMTEQTRVSSALLWDEVAR